MSTYGFEDRFREHLISLTRQNGLGTLDARAAESLYGINYRANGLYLPTVTDQTGLTLWTKTDMNLQEGNIAHDRHFSGLSNGDDLTLQRAVRAFLDPYGATESGYATPLVNNKSPWITPLTNALVSVSGWPDNTMGAYTHPEGAFGETISMIDGNYKIRGPFSLTCTFTNIEGGIISRLFDIWGLYSENVIGNKMIPYPWNNYMSMMDYTTRQWRLVLDPSRRFCRHIAYTGYCFPKVNPQGGLFNFDMEQNFNQDNSKLTIEFQAVGAVYNDPLSFFVFNYLAYMFNPDLKITNYNQLHREDIKLAGANKYYRVTARNMDLTNFYCYLLINPLTRELCWYIEKDVFNMLINNVPEFSSKIDDAWQPPLV